MEIINLTPHSITLYLDSGETLTIPASGTIARANERAGEEYCIDGLPVPCVTAPTFLGVDNLPDPQPGIVYLVSMIVRESVYWREDVFSPSFSGGDCIRDDQGRILGTRRLVGNRVKSEE